MSGRHFGECDCPNGQAYALDTGDGSGAGWPMFSHDLQHSGLFSDTVASPPRALSITPNHGRNDQETPVTIGGSDFQPLPAAYLGGTPLLDVTYISSSTLTATVPAGMAVGIYTLTVTNPDSQSATLPDAFTVTYPPPEVLGITPAGGYNTGPILVAVTGTHFLANAALSLERPGEVLQATATVVVSSTLLTGTLDLTGATTGTWDVVVANPDGRRGVLAEGFSVSAPAQQWKIYLPLVVRGP